MNRSNSERLYNEARRHTPCGVSSPVRAFTPYPVFMEKGRGGLIIDVDGNDYVDLCMAYGPLILGHSNRVVMDAARRQLERGTVYGTPSEAELGLLKRICARVPCAESARLMNSGTEATMHALRLARGFTGKKGVVMMNGGFHGAHDALLAGISEDPFSTVPSWSKGVPGEAVANTYSVEYNDAYMLDSLLCKRDDIAAVIMEPVMGNRGVIPPKNGYLDDVRRITSEHGALLIFDEVITGFRVARDSAQGIYGVTPDLCTLGKIIGGGFPAGAVAGKREIMDDLAPSGKVYQAGTFSGNPVTAAAGSAAIDMLTKDVYTELGRKTDETVSVMEDILTDTNVHGCIQSVNSMFQVFFGTDSVENHRESVNVDAIIYREMFGHMLDSGVYMPPSAFEVNFICSEHTDAQLAAVTDAFGRFTGGRA